MLDTTFYINKGLISVFPEAVFCGIGFLSNPQSLKFL